MSLIDRVRISRRFQRSIKIDSDLGDPKALEGFVCPQTFTNVLLTMAKHVSETGQGAFTWTGPYGSGKSSLVVALSALLNGNKDLQKHASTVIGNNTAKKLWEGLPPGSKGWRVLPVIGRRERPYSVIGEALERYDFIKRDKRREWTDLKVIETLVKVSAEESKQHGGLIVFIDEMGKFLEGAAQEGTDIYIFQQLAEAASRSNRRLIIVGVLHQAFEEYANRLSRDIRDEWSKIQGRFVDLAVNTGGEEQIDLLARAIDCDSRPSSHKRVCDAVSDVIAKNRSTTSKTLSESLENCWPLHPIVASLLGPLSRRRFGQNQRSTFGFLSSAEPSGFQDFLKGANDSSLYGVDRLWDYLKANLEQSILASPDGHRWSLAVDVVERCETLGGESLHLLLLKTIALVELFKERSGLSPSLSLLESASLGASKPEIQTALNKLAEWSLVIFKKYNDAYAVYAGSDFDIEHALDSARETVKEVDFTQLKSIAGIQPILAKRHYHDTGALRWFDVNLAALGSLVSEIGRYKPQNGTIGQFVLALPTEGQTKAIADELCSEVASQQHEWNVVVGTSKRAWAVVDLAKELIALEKVSSERGELVSDLVARREVEARISDLQTRLEVELHRAFDSAIWYVRRNQQRRIPLHELNSLASELAAKRFPDSPRLNNELLNRQRPSSNAIAAQNELIKRMVINEGEPRLGIVGFPAEGGLFASLLESTKLYKETRSGWRFVAPEPDDPHHFFPLWNATDEFLKNQRSRAVPLSEVFDLWRQPPFGIKDGVMSTLSIAFALSKNDTVAMYRDGMFLSRLKDIDVESLSKDPSSIRLRWMDLSETSRRLLMGLSEVVRNYGAGQPIAEPEPFEVAKGLIATFDSLHPWTKRTTRLSANAARVRNLLKNAHDPNKLLFDDIPSALGKKTEGLTDSTLDDIVRSVQEGFEELSQAYPTMLNRLRDSLLAELQVHNMSSQALAELRDRAKNARQLAGDLRIDAFVVRLSNFTENGSEVEGIASLAAGKPLRDWVDLDLDRASVEMIDMAQKFLRSEAFARVKGRRDKRHSMAVVVGMGGRPTPILEEFHITDLDRVSVDRLIVEVETALQSGNHDRRHVILAALAELSARYMQLEFETTKSGGKKRRIS